MKVKRGIANLFIKRCRLYKLQNSKPQRFIRAVMDEIDLQHLRNSYPCRSCGDRAEMYRYVHDSCINGEALDYLEFGVFQGDSIRQWTALSQNKESRFFGFDSFEGLPEDWRSGQGKGHFDVGGAVPRIDDPRVSFVKGWFENSIPVFARSFHPNNRLLLHVDADLYSSAMLALVYFSPFMAKGSLIIFDEFYDREHEFKALIDWRRIYKRNYRIIAEMANYGKICVELE